MKSYLLLFLSISTTLLTAQSAIFTPDEEEDIYNYFLEEEPFNLLPQETFKINNYLEFKDGETIDLIEDHRLGGPKIKISYTDSGFVFCNIATKQQTASFGLMKDVSIYFDYVHRSEDLEQHISFNWEYSNTYDGVSGSVPVKIRRQFNPEGEEVSVDIWIEIPEDSKSKKANSTLFLHGEIIKDKDQNQQPLYRL